MLNRHAYRKHFARRTRRGASLLEVGLVAVIGVVVITQLSTLASVHANKRAAQLDARYLTDLAQAGRNLVVGQAQVIVTGTPLTLTPAQLEAAGLLEGGRTSQSATGRDYSVIALRRSANEVVVMARGTVRAGETAPGTWPETGEGIARVGIVDVNAPNFVRGPALNYDLSWMTGGFAAARPAPGDLVALNVVRRDQSITPYLHRTQNSLFPELNQMQTDLDMGGNNILNAQTITADTIDLRADLTAQSLSATTTVHGALSAGSLTTTGALSVGGNLRVSGNVEAMTGVFSGDVNAATVAATSGQFANSLTAQDLTVTQGLIAIDLAADNVVTDAITSMNATTRHLTGDLITTNRVTSSTRGDFQTLTTGGCSGC